MRKIGILIKKWHTSRLRRGLQSQLKKAYREHGQINRVQRYYLLVTELNQSREFRVDLEYEECKVITIWMPWTNKYDPPPYILREIEELEVKDGRALHYSYMYEYDHIGVDMDHVCAIYKEAV